MAKNDKDQNKKKGRFFKDMKAELKKVVWPSAKQTSNNTVAVIAFTLALALIVFVLDLCFDALNKHGVVKKKKKITSSYSASHENTTDENSESSEGVENKDEEDATNIEAEATTKDGEAETNTESQE